jgi:hypothetical protein
MVDFTIIWGWGAKRVMVKFTIIILGLRGGESYGEIYHYYSWVEGGEIC